MWCEDEVCLCVCVGVYCDFVIVSVYRDETAGAAARADTTHNVTTLSHRHSDTLASLALSVSGRLHLQHRPRPALAPLHVRHVVVVARARRGRDRGGHGAAGGRHLPLDRVPGQWWVRP